MNRTSAHASLPLRVAAGFILATGLATAAVAQDGRPQPANPDRNGGTEASAPADAVADAGTANDLAGAVPGAVVARGPLGRKLPPDELVSLIFNDEEITKLLTYIAEETGKVVIPVDLGIIGNKRFTILKAERIPRARALDIVFESFRLSGVGVIEDEEMVIVGDLNSLGTTLIPPIVSATDDIEAMPNDGGLVSAFFQLKKVKASQALDILSEKDLPAHVKLAADDNSNQILVFGDVRFAKKIKELIDQLDETFKQPKTQTFRLAYADAVEIDEQINALYSDSGGGSSSGRGATPSRNRGGGGRGAQAPTPGDAIGPEIELRTTVNTQQNSVTVVGDPDVVDEIARLIDEDWDKPRKPGSNRIYTLRYTDPLKVEATINELLGQSSGAGGGGARGRVGGGQGGTDVADALAGIYQIRAFPDNNQLIVLAKTEESLGFLDKIINDLDQPTEIGLPFVVELKHANAVELAEQLNALLAEPGSGATIRAPEEGLSGRGLGDDSTGGAGGGDAGSAGTLQFPWQRSGRQNDEQSPESQLIGKVRIVPIVRQNALAVLCPRPQSDAVKDLVGFFDRPGRQVMLSVIIAEVDLTNDLALGLRLSTDQDILSTALPDNVFSAGLNGTGNRTGSGGSLFDSTVLDASVNLNVLLQALDQDSNVRVIQQPVVFTADNQEAFFFDGQQIPFITETTINSQGNPTDSFEYQDVGVILNARPRITANREVDIDLRLELSAVVPGQTLFGGAIIDKRETTTNVVVRNGQTIVLSGILRESESKITRKVPLLGDIPLLGELFTSRTNQTITSELVAFITPMVVDDPTENDSNFQEEWRQRLEQLSLPIADQVQRLEDNPDMVQERFRPSRSSTPDSAPVADPGTELVDPERSGAEVYEPKARRLRGVGDLGDGTS